MMEQVMTPFTANAFYFCDPDGRTEFVQSREPYPVDDGTPSMKRFCFENITAKDCHVAASYFDGLPEQKIEQITMRNVSVSFRRAGKMRRADHVKRCGSMLQKGLYARNVKKLVLDNVSIEGCEERRSNFTTWMRLSGRRRPEHWAGRRKKKPGKDRKMQLGIRLHDIKKAPLESGLPLHMSRDLPADIWRWQR